MKYMPSFLLKQFFIIALSFVSLNTSLFAGGPPLDVTAGNQATPVTIYWNVVGGSGTCQGQLNPINPYPLLTSDNVQIDWLASGQDKPANGSISFTKFYADPGPVGGYKDYDFICKDRVSAAQDTVTIRLRNPCATGQYWDTSTASCKDNASASFTTSAANKTCTISANNNRCTPTLSWTSSGATSVWLTDCGNGIYGSFGTGAQSAQVWTPYSSGCYVIQYGGVNNSGFLSGGTILTPQEITSASCAPGTLWNGAICRTTNCPDGQYWDTVSTSCKSCSNGGCTGTGGTPTDPIPLTLKCINGSTGGTPLCPTPISGSCSIAHYACSSGTSVNNQNLADRWTWICTGSNGGANSGLCTEMKPPMTGILTPNGGLSCEIQDEQSSCALSFTWLVNYPRNPNGTVITRSPDNTTLMSGSDTGTQNLNVLYEVPVPSQFYLYNNGALLAQSGPLSADCKATSAWDSVTGKCQVCGYGGCKANPPHTCVNGSIAPACIPPAPIASLTISTPDFPSHIPAGSTGVNNIAGHGEKVRLSWGAIANATACTLSGLSGGPVAASVSGSSVEEIATGWSGFQKTYTLTCTGPGGAGPSSSVTASYPAPPTGVSLICTPDGETATASWTSAGLNTYTTSAWEKVGVAPATEITDPAIKKTGYTGPTTLPFAIDPKGPLTSPSTSLYTVKVQSQAANGALSAESSASKPCARPLPVVTFTTHTQNGGTSGSAYYDEASTAYLSWSATNNATSCTLKRGAATIYSGNQVTNANFPLPNGDTRNTTTTYDLTCSNSTGGATVSKQVSVPPPSTVTNMVNCPAPGNQGTIAWTYPGGYNRGIYNVLRPSVHPENPVVCGTKPDDICVSESNATSHTFPALLGETYVWWVRTEHPTNTNFSSSVGGSFTCSAPDLMAGAVSLGSGVPTTETMTLTTMEASVLNYGNQDTPASFKSYIQVSDTYNTITGLGDGPYHNVPHVTLPVALKNSGNTQFITGSYTFPTAGTYAVRACADQSQQGDSGTVVESNENNNCGPWTPVTVQSLPRVTLTPGTDQTLYPKTPLTINSTATDADGNLRTHDITVTVNGVEYKNTALIASEGTVTINTGEVGNFNPDRATNSYSAIFTASKPGTYAIKAQAKESIYTNYVTKLITVTVACRADEWWNLTDCVKPNVTVTASCANGAINPTTCDICKPTDVFYNGRCINAGVCYAQHYNLRPFTCGNGVVDSGEECDGQAGLSNAATQRCTNKCTITCASGASNIYGAPSCGAGADNVFNSASQKVKACVNGALQSSAPNCNICPNGESAVAINGKTFCKAPFCGNGLTDSGTTEQCDGANNVTPGKFCTSNCCLVNELPRLPEVDLIPTYTLSCSDADRYQILDSGRNILKSGVYAAPVTFTPTAPGTYTYKCFYSGNTNSFLERPLATTLPSATSSGTGRTTLNVSPKSISKNSAVTISWITNLPDNQCSVRVAPVITSPTKTCDELCIAARFKETNRINSDLRLGVTDINDLGVGNAARPILDAMQTVPTALIPTATKAIGKKTVNLNYTTIFYASCSANPVADPNASKVKVSVTGDSEN